MELNLKHIIDQVGKDKGIDREIIVEALKQAMLQAAQKKLGGERNLEAQFNEDAGEVELFEFRSVVDEVLDPDKEWTVEESRTFDPEAEIGDEIGIKIDMSTFGRIDAQAAKQVIIQKVRDAEREIIFNEYKDRKAELVTGIARRFERGDIIVDLGRAEAVLPVREQVPRESYRAGDRVQAYMADVTKNTKGPQIILSRTHPGLLLKLFEMEVPEIYEGIVKIESVAREPGARSKIAVSSRDGDVDPVGACVGMKGSRVQAVVQELRGEKIDIVPFDSEPARFVCNALAPAEVSRVLIDRSNQSMEVIVPDDQLSLAIGRKGQNVRLASQLTGWKLDIFSEPKLREMRENAMRSLSRIEGVGETLLELLYNHGMRSAQAVAGAVAEDLARVPGVTPDMAERIKAAATAAVENERREAVEARAAAIAAREAADAADAEPQGEAEPDSEAGEAPVEPPVAEETGAA